MIRKPVAILLVLSLAVLALALVPTAGFAAKGGNGGGNGGGGGGKPGGDGGSSSLSLVALDPDDGGANHGEQVTFAVSTSEPRPFVGLNCYQSGVWVYSASAGFFPDYPWGQTFTLATTSWTSGAADCTARLYKTKDGTRTTTLATLSFHVYA